MQEKILELINKLIPAIIIALAFLLPLFFLPITAEFFEFPKICLLLVACCLLLLLWALRMLLEKQVRIIRTPLDLGMIFLLLASCFLPLASQNRIVSLTDLSTWVWILLPLFYFVVVNNLRTKKQLSYCLTASLLSGGVLAVWAIIQYAVGQSGSLPVWMRSRAFSPVGGIPTLSVYLLATISLVVAQFTLLRHSERSEESRRPARQSPTLQALAGGDPSPPVAGQDDKKVTAKDLVLRGLVGFLAIIALLLINPLTSGPLGKITGVDYPRPVLLDFKTSWAIATETIKNYPLFGIGPGLFGDAFSQFKPLGFNNSPYWNIRFGVAHNQWMQMLTTGGLLDLAVFAFLVFVVVQFTLLRHSERSEESRRPARQSPTLQALAGGDPSPPVADQDDKKDLVLRGLVVPLLLSSLFITWTTPIAFLFFLLLALGQKGAFLEKPDPEREVQISVLAIPTIFPLPHQNDTVYGVKGKGKGTELLPKLIIGPITLFSLFGLYALGRAFAADFYHRRSLTATFENKGPEAYEYQRRAISLNPYSNLYRRNYAQINLALANSLAARPDLIAEDRADIQQLIQQAVREVKIISEKLAPRNVLNWEVRGQIYRNLIGIAENAEMWAAAAFQQAIFLDPLNPRLRIDLGGIYYAQDDFERAAWSFAEAVQLKPNYANAHYNLAATFRKQEKFKEAIREMEIVLRLVPQDSVDYQKAESELKELITEGTEGKEGTEIIEITEGTEEATPSAIHQEEATPSARP